MAATSLRAGLRGVGRLAGQRVADVQRRTADLGLHHQQSLPQREALADRWADWPDRRPLERCRHGKIAASVRNRGASDDLSAVCWQLQLGNDGLTAEEQKSHYTLWALMNSPLLLGTDITNMAVGLKALLLNAEIAGLNQDALGYPGRVALRLGNGVLV